ncbi:MULTISPECIES: RluA family pseudouridine synthase [Tenacibaculum]|uniref:RluA family pseudouridine synthase n=1 Tax=Tenacibaculum TaxID=104267 RepID=UPI00089B477D|nr:RluA family pseudouridine synthase [Tenacibaculum sp. MAR_2010_89]SEE55433.1 tRNA pseudouridine32 synthase / 23S rRNA pseudouridine746 synthase [Tenacibaculum sp. MAR_2010_89]
MNKLHYFKSDTTNIQLPKKIGYPHNYTPHSIAKIAAEELQEYLLTQSDFKHDFGLSNNSTKALGKMFGVLVVKHPTGKIGYIAAFSGKMANKTQHNFFVPPVFDILAPNGFYIQIENKLNIINEQIHLLTNKKEYLELKKQYYTQKKNHEELLNQEHSKVKRNRKLRKKQQLVNNQLNINEEFYLREYEVYLNDKINSLRQTFLNYENKIELLKKQRAETSANIQQKIFKHYLFTNANLQSKNLLDIFNNTQNIPAGSGDCCAPKLFQYAFKHQLTPIALAEFWWGKPLTTSIRKHLHYYVACSGKCKPILNHMLQGLIVEENPLIKKLNKPQELNIIYEDKYMLAINKPAEFLTVAGKEISYTIESLVREKYPNATGPLVVHRLDMSTSGILLIAKTKETHKELQAQFINKTIQKRYVAIVNGILPNQKGTINLPLRVDLEDRPKQLVCYEYGKEALTHWETVSANKGRTKIYLYPITGRTHQLRVHMAHHLGLNSPIVGDDLYGTKSNRLHLHAESISFIHPVTKKEMKLTIPVPF